MAVKLNQIVALVQGAKTDANKRTAPLFHMLNQAQLFAGLTQRYRPAEEGGTQLPDDTQRVQHTVPEVLEKFRAPNERLLDLIMTNETANMSAQADIEIDGDVILESVPVTFLMQFQKFLEQEVRGLVNNLPVQDPAEDWSPSPAERNGIWESDEVETFRTRKVQRPIVLYDATDKHPAQTQLITEDVVDGYWKKKRFTGAISQSRKDELIERLERLVAAVKSAREKANDQEVVDHPAGQAVFNYLFA